MIANAYLIIFTCSKEFEKHHVILYFFTVKFCLQLDNNFNKYQIYLLNLY